MFKLNTKKLYRINKNSDEAMISLPNQNNLTLNERHHKFKYLHCKFLRLPYSGCGTPLHKRSMQNRIHHSKRSSEIRTCQNKRTTIAKPGEFSHI